MVIDKSISKQDLRVVKTLVQKSLINVIKKGKKRQRDARYRKRKIEKKQAKCAKNSFNTLQLIKTVLRTTEVNTYEFGITKQPFVNELKFYDFNEYVASVTELNSDEKTWIKKNTEDGISIYEYYSTKCSLLAENYNNDFTPIEYMWTDAISLVSNEIL